MNAYAWAFLVVAILFFLLFCVAMLGLIIAVVFAIRYGRMVLAWEENINESLDILDRAYANMWDVLQKPLFHDSPEVRSVLAEIHNCRESVLWISNALTMPARPKYINEQGSEINVIE